MSPLQKSRPESGPGRRDTANGLGTRPVPLAWLSAACAALLAVGAVGAAESSAPAGSNAPPRVVKVSEPLQLGQPVRVHLEGLRQWVDAGNSSQKLLLYLEGRPSLGDYPESVNNDTGDLVYHLRITPDNRDLWQDILRQPMHLSRKILVSVGPTADSHFWSAQPGQNAVTLEVVPSPWGVVSFAVLGLTLAALLYLARRTDLIRDAGPASIPGRRKPYSLARSQMAIWFYLIFAAYLAIWLVTGDLNTITESILALMGISAGTALGGTLIDNQKRATAAAQPALVNPPNSGAANPPAATTPATAGPTTAVPAPAPLNTASQVRDLGKPEVSEGFLRDVLRDGDGFSLHRFQILAWTIALGVIFIATAYNTLRMPDFSATLLGLMGISAGTYLGFKVPEK